MKLKISIICLVSFLGCHPAKENSEENKFLPFTTEVLRTDFQQIIDAANVTGSILIFNPQEATFYSNNLERCKTGFLPASTYKIVNSIIALETGVIKSDSTIIKWDGNKRQRKEWEKDLTLNEAFHVSCVPCYQEIARKIGMKRMHAYLNTLQYGHMVFDSSSIDMFWLEGQSKISQFEQIDFLQRFYAAKLPISEKTFFTMKRMLVLEENEHYKLSGKTGWAIRNENNYGWFVGYIEKGNEVYYFAANIEPKAAFNMDLFPKIRSEITLETLNKLGFLE